MCKNDVLFVVFSVTLTTPLLPGSPDVVGSIPIYAYLFCIKTYDQNRLMKVNWLTNDNK